MTTIDYKQLAAQLSCPQGEHGVEVGHRMNLSNISMTQSSLYALDLNTNDRLLEVGHGNCGHLDFVYSTFGNIHYHGIEISETMYQEAINNNLHLSQKYPVKFYLYEGQKLPFQENYFDKILTVNTIYFWKDVRSFLKEIHRVLKPNGVFTIAFAHKSFMTQLPFVRHGFKLYSPEEVTTLLTSSSFTIDDLLDFEEGIQSKVNTSVTRQFSVIRALKL